MTSQPTPSSSIANCLPLGLIEARRPLVRSRGRALFILIAFAAALALAAPRPAAAATPIDVTVTIQSYHEITCPDDTLVPCPGDYYGKIAIGPNDFVATPQGPTDTGDFSPFWRVTQTLDRDQGRFQRVRIELFDDDEDGFNNDDQVDISSGTDTLELTVDLDDGSWGGDSGVNNTWSRGNSSPASAILYDISLSKTGDVDADGIPDGVERFGLRDVNNGNLIADLKRFGSEQPQPADPCQKTILMEIDYMTGAADGHTHRPQDTALTEVQDAFAAAPVKATADCPYAFSGFGKAGGVQLLIERGNAIPEKPVYGLGDLATTRGAAENFDPARRPYFHYVVFAHDQAAGSSSSGRCCDGGKDLIVTLGSWARQCVRAGADGKSNTTPLKDDQLDANGNISNGADRTCDTTANAVKPADDRQVLAVGDSTSDQAGTPRHQSSTIMHELGHALGLAHGGGQDVNNAPNYLSAMNYTFQQGIPLAAGGSKLDYSTQALTTIDEARLDERAGIGGPAQYATYWYDPTGTSQIALAAGQIDWDRDGTVESSTDVDTNLDSGCVGPGANGKLDTLPLGDDALQNGLIVNGADDACNTVTPAGDDMQLSGGSGPSGADSNTVCVGPGPDETIASAKGGDDSKFTNVIQTGPNLVCDSTAGGDDVQVVPVGKSESRTRPGYDDWANLRFRAALSGTAAGAGAGHPGDLDYVSVLRAEERLDVLLDPDLEATKVVDKADANAGDKLTYTVTARNVGTGDAANVKVTDTMPDGTVQERRPANIYAGAAPTETFTYDVPCATADGAVLKNTVAVSSSDMQSAPEKNAANNSASASTNIHAPVLTLAKTATATVNAGESVRYRLTYANTGSGDASGVVITDRLPAGVYYSAALDRGAGPKPMNVTLNADGSRTLSWSVGSVAAKSGPAVIDFTARPTLLAPGGTEYVNTASLVFTDASGCKYPPLSAAASTTITVVAASRDPLTIGYWRNHPEDRTSEILDRIQATDQRYDGADGSLPDGRTSSAEVSAALAPAGAPQAVLAQQLLAVYFNLAGRRINAGTAITSKTATRLGLTNVRDAALYARATLSLAASANRSRYSDATQVTDEVNRNASELYGP